MKDGMFLSDYSSEHFYKIQAVSKSDAGNYQCYAKNSVGTIISESIPLTNELALARFKFPEIRTAIVSPRKSPWGLLWHYLS